MLSKQKRMSAMIFLPLMSCIAGGNEVKFCKEGQWPGSAIQIDKLNGDSRFDDMSGKLQKCSQTPICISFPLILQAGSWGEGKNFDVMSWKAKILKSGRLTSSYKNNIWTYNISSAGNIDSIVIDETHLGVRTKYISCGEALTLNDIISFGQSPAGHLDR